MELSIEGQKRIPGSKPNALRREGRIPAVLYGHNGSESIALTIGAKDVEVLLKKAKVTAPEVQLTIPELSWNGKAVLQEVQTHPSKGYVYHVSFFSGNQ
ncbi:MAG: 50S ribosomal protein L25 [Leptolyngbyaceae cyanobacterium SL_7_1]|nr:50S ribosomal protein L25 [Leptolyngbyaceae cyanobacterium SL_7_1]